MEQLTIIYRSGVVVEVTCEDYSYSEHAGLRVEGVKPEPIMLGEKEIAAIWRGPIVGAHDPPHQKYVASS